MEGMKMKVSSFEEWSPWTITKTTSDYEICPKCLQSTRMEFVHGHYQCSECKSVVVDCCNGEGG
ncbi:MAG: hypothetical protein CMD09_03285 [Flavobacteriales bacterium]|nr:hypothetical protein [Flavobacteriales bacterium]